MSIMNITDSIKVCHYLKTYRLTHRITGLPQDTAAAVLESGEERDCLKALAQMCSSAQVNIVSRQETMDLYCGLVSKNFDRERMNQLFGDAARVPELTQGNLKDIEFVLGSPDVPKDFIHFYLQHTGILEREGYTRFWRGCHNISEQAGLSPDWCYEHYDITVSGIVWEYSFLSLLADYKAALCRIAGDRVLADFLELLISLGIEKVTQGVFEQICKDRDKIVQGFGSLVAEVPDDRKSSFTQYWIQNERLLADLNKLKRKTGTASSWDFTDSRLDYIAFCNSEVVDFPVAVYQEELISYALQNKKKAFMKLVRQNSVLFGTVGVKSVLYCPKFYRECININTLNKADLSGLAGMAVSEYQVERLAHNNLTFKEFRVLYASRAEVVELYYNLDIPSVDEKLNIIREFNTSVTCLGEDGIRELPKYLRIKKLSDWRNDEFSHIKRINYNTVVKLLTCYDDLQKFIKDIRDRTEAERICQNIGIYRDMRDIMDIRESVVGTDEDWKKLQSELQLTDEFVNLNKDSIAEFILQNGAAIAYSYLCGGSSQLSDLKKLVTAEVTGRFRELKYPPGGLTRELGTAVGEDVYSLWRSNSGMQAGPLKIWEEDGFIPVMQIGVVPTRTCLAYDDGIYRECLLSNFDTGKKIVFVSKGDDIILRAVLRFTKGSTSADNVRDTAFIDVTRQAVREDTVLFLEKAYSVIESREEKYSCFRAMSGMLRDRARELNAVMLFHKMYADWADDLMQTEYHLYIAASKTGNQYLDSLGAKAAVQDESRYYGTQVLVHREDVQLLQ